MMNTFIFVLCLVTSGASYTVYGTQNSLKEDLELERQLKLINKPPIKSIHTKFGKIIDCIDINKQPAFDHPLLKNHKLQRKPNFQKSIGKTSVKNSPARSIFGLDKDKCPVGTVPIMRTTKDDLIRGKSLSNDHIMTQDNRNNGIHLAEVRLLPNFGPYYGVRGINSIYNPKLIRMDQISASNLWVRNGPINATNKIVVGWHVLPRLYGDDATHFHAAWTSDNFQKTGCYNIQCPGFVLTTRENYLGARLDNTSTYGGQIYQLSITITKDPVAKNWWLVMSNNQYIGYFPAALFSNMASANQVGWGGRTWTPPGYLDPPMGSGHFPDGNLQHACYFDFVSFQDASRQHYKPQMHQVQTFSDNPNCFGVKYYGDTGSKAGCLVQFGGEGGLCDND